MNENDPEREKNFNAAIFVGMTGIGIAVFIIWGFSLVYLFAKGFGGEADPHLLLFLLGAGPITAFLLLFKRTTRGIGVGFLVPAVFITLYLINL